MTPGRGGCRAGMESVSILRIAMAADETQSGNAAWGSQLPDLRKVADEIVENEDVCSAANWLRTAQDEIDRLHAGINDLIAFYAPEEAS